MSLASIFSFFLVQGTGMDALAEKIVIANEQIEITRNQLENCSGEKEILKNIFQIGHAKTTTCYTTCNF